jgi:hypothetical protein
MASPIDFSKLDPTKLDEYAKADPIWQAVQDYLNTIPMVRDFSFLGRMTDTFLFVSDLLAVLRVGGPHIVRHKMQGIPEMMREFVVPEVSGDALDFLTKAMQTQFEEKVRQYEPWLVNQGVVMLCTLLDVYWEDTLDAIFRKQVQLLYRPDEARTIDLRQVVELGSVEAVVTDFRQREVRRFGFLDTEKRLDYMESRCKIERAAIFDWSHFTEDAQKELKDHNAKSLKRIYDDRHSIVHADRLPLRTLADLEPIKNFFDKVLLNIAREAVARYGLLRELQKPLMLQPLYEKFKAARQAQ